MKKIFFVLAIALCTASSVFAEDMKVMALKDFSTDKPSEIKVQVLQTMKLDEGVVIEQGSVVTGVMVDVIPAKRLKRDATFSFMPTSFVTPKRVRYSINRKYVGKFSPKIEIDKAELAKTAALSVGDYFVKGLSTGFYAVQGAIKDEKGNRFVSSVQNVYENSLLSYIEKGDATCIKAQSMFTFRFPDLNPDESVKLGPALTKLEGLSSEVIPALLPEVLHSDNTQD